MKMNLLEIVQDILNEIDSDAVNSITDTVESEQIAQIVKTAYFEIISKRNWPHLRKLFQFSHVGDLNKPNYLRLPPRIKELEFFKYECQDSEEGKIELKAIIYKYPDEFLQYISNRNSKDATVSTVIDFSGSKLLIKNNIAPTYWTSFDDEYIVTDSYDQAVDDTLQSSKTQCYGYIFPTWAHEDTFIPDIPDEVFPALLAEAKSTAFVSVKQMVNQKVEQKAARQQRWLSQSAWSAKGGIRYPNYGRKGNR
jgi:hypothetical protein